MSKNKRESKIMEWLLVLQVGCWSQWKRERWFNEKILNCMLKAGLPSKQRWKGCVRKQEEFSSSVSGKWSFFVPGDPMDRIQRSYEVCTWTTAKTSLYRLAESKGKASRHGMLKALFIPWPEQTSRREEMAGRPGSNSRSWCWTSVLTRDVLLPRGPRAIPGDIFLCSQLRAAGIWWVNILQHVGHLLHASPSPAKKYSAQNVHSTEAEKPCVN